MIYYLLISLPIISIFFYHKSYRVLEETTWILLFFILLFFLGFRNNIGGDWSDYKNIFEYTNFSDLNGIKSINLFYFIILFFNYLNVKSIYFYNFLFSLIYLIALFKLCNQFKYKWMSLLSTMPYLTLIVSTGYVKQTLSISFVLIALSIFIKNDNPKKTFLYLFLGFLSHISSAYLFILSLTSKNIKYFLLFFILLILYLNRDLFELLSNYLIEYEKSSKGFLYRVSINIIYIFPILFLLYKKKITESEKILIYLNIIVITTSLILILFLPNISTFLDRLNLYMICFFPYYTNLIFKNIKIFPFINNFKIQFFFILFYMFNITYFFIWSNLGDAFNYWKFYENIIFKILLIKYYV